MQRTPETIYDRDDDWAARVRDSIIINHFAFITHVYARSQFEHSEKVKSNFNNYIITLWATARHHSSTFYRRQHRHCVRYRVHGMKLVSNYTKKSCSLYLWKTTSQLMSAKCASLAQHNKIRSKEWNKKKEKEMKQIDGIPEQSSPVYFIDFFSGSFRLRDRFFPLNSVFCALKSEYVRVNKRACSYNRGKRLRVIHIPNENL